MHYKNNVLATSKLWLIALVCTAIGLLCSAGVAYADDASSKRLAGDRCFETAALISAEGFEAADTVVIATYDGYWDALAAAPVAGANNAPILFAEQDQLPKATIDAIKKLKPSRAIIVGGDAVVSDTVAAELKNMNLELERYAGPTAVDTANELAKAAKKSLNSDTCVIATSSGFYDALSIAPIAYNMGYPVFLTEASEGNLLKESKDLIANQYDNAIIVGGNAVVSTETENWLKENSVGVTRLAGDNAWETSAAIANYALDNGFSASHIGIADGNGYWDALAGAALCGSLKSPVILVPHDGVNYDGGFFSYDPHCIDTVLKEHAAEVTRAYVFGGESVVPPTTVNEIDSAVNSVPSYAVTYTDGVEDEEVFADQVCAVKKGQATPEFDGTPKREGYTFAGWEPEVAETVLADVVYVAQWTPIEYTVTYTDGVEDEEVFADQVCAVKKGQATPEFDGTPERDGYTFAGWEPEVAETVTKDVCYSATWEKVPPAETWYVYYVYNDDVLSDGKNGVTDENGVTEIFTTDKQKAEENAVTLNFTGFDFKCYWENETGSQVGEEDFMRQHLSSLAIKRVSQVEVESPIKICNGENLFKKREKLTKINGLENMDVSEAKSMKCAFVNCEKLETIEGVENWDTSNVSDFSHMFAGNEALTTLAGLENWDTSNVSDFSHMFDGNEALTTLAGLENFDLTKAKNLSSMFTSNEKLSDISAIESWNVSNVDDMSCMFSGGKAIKDLSPLNSWEPKEGANIDKMFEYVDESVERPTWA